METASDRRALADAWGDVATIGAVRVPGQYDEPHADDIDVSATAPVFRALRADLEAAGVTASSAGGTTVDAIATHDGRDRGPFAVVDWQPLDDGAFVELRLRV